jgi:DNA-binding IscR family transcriptional regulator
VLDVVEVIDGSEPAFTCTEIRRRGPSGGLPARTYPRPCGVHVVMNRADAAWRRELAAVSIADLVDEVVRNVSPRAAVKAAAWFQEVLR